MKTKYFSLAAFAFTFAIGGAFASVLALEDVYVKAKFSTLPSAPIECINTHAQCDNTGSLACQINVPLSGGGFANVTTAGPQYPYRVSCIVRLKNSQNIVIEAQLPQNERPVSVVAE
jgi:hypothetical protein